MLYATLILYYHASLLTLQTSLIHHAIWLILGRLECVAMDHEFMIMNTKSPKFSLLELPYIKSDGMVLKTNFLACPTTMGGPRFA